MPSPNALFMDAAAESVDAAAGPARTGAQLAAPKTKLDRYGEGAACGVQRPNEPANPNKHRNHPPILLAAPTDSATLRLRPGVYERGLGSILALAVF
jgi:hypothetical protein